MSRVGKRVLEIPQNVKFSLMQNMVKIEGPLGKLEFLTSPLIAIHQKENQITTTRANEAKHTKQLHGTTNSLISNMLQGVSKGFSKTLIVSGVGFRTSLKGNNLELLLGYSHPVNFTIPEGLKVEIPKPLTIKISGISKEKVGQFAAEVRQARRASVYSGKGIIYSDEVVRRKEGKKASK